MIRLEKGDITKIDYVEAIVNAANSSLLGGGGVDGAIHRAAGPVWNGGSYHEDELLADCYRNSLKLAAETGIRTIAFPSISTGIYSFPVERAAKIAVRTADNYLKENPGQFDLVCWVLFDDRTKMAYQAAVDTLLGSGEKK